MTARSLLVFLLRLGGTMTVLAFPAMLLPPDWMAATHRWLGMGELPEAPVVDYLARSVSALYGFHGVLLFLIATDPARYRPFVVYVGCMNVAFGLMLLLIALSAGMPGWWTAFEGPGLVTLGVVVLFLSRVAGAPAPIARSREPADRDDTLFLC
jgi:hypothetical protein